LVNQTQHCELYCSVVTKEQLLNNAKHPVFKLKFVPIFTYGHEF